MGILVLLVLAGLVMPMICRASTAAQKSQAANDMTQVTTAVMAFRTDYGSYPIDPSVSRKVDAVYGCPGWSHHNSEVLNVLRADGADPGPNFRDAVNTRKVEYMDIPIVRDLSNPKRGLGTGKESNGFGVTTAGEFYDPWGSPYIIFIDANGDGFCDLGRVYSDFTSPGANRQAQVTAASLGPDKQIGTKGNRKFAGSDDVILGYPY